MSTIDFIISEKMRLNKIVKLFPASVEVFKSHNLKAIGCCTIPVDPLEDVMKKEGFSQEKILQVVLEINNLKAEAESLDAPKPSEEDFELKMITEGNKKYYKLAGMLFSESAYSNLHSLADDHKGLSIRLEAGGCSGYKYKYDYVDKTAEDEKEFKLSEKLSIYLNDFSFGKLSSSVVDFKIGLHDSGIKIINPNMKGACSCGTSISV